LNEKELNQLMSGMHPIQLNKAYKDAAEKISNLVEKYNDIPILVYLEGISNNFKLQV
jgi:hypothetical protein